MNKYFVFFLKIRFPSTSNFCFSTFYAICILKRPHARNICLLACSFLIPCKCLFAVFSRCFFLLLYFACSVVIPLCGGNIEPTILGRAIERGLTADGRMVRFIVKIGDRPGSLGRLTSLVVSTGVRYVSVTYNVAFGSCRWRNITSSLNGRKVRKRDL